MEWVGIRDGCSNALRAGDFCHLVQNAATIDLILLAISGLIKATRSLAFSGLANVANAVFRLLATASVEALPTGIEPQSIAVSPSFFTPLEQLG
jgi:hypothetical protein